jgi:hypothetical protein
MSIINNAHPGSSIRLLCLIDRVLNRQNGPIQREKLKTLCCPENLPTTEGARKRFDENLKFWIDEGLWVEHEGGITQSFSDCNEDNLPERVLRRLTKRVNEADDDALLKGKRVAPLMRCLSCLLALDEFTFFNRQGALPGTAQNIAAAINRFLPPQFSINESNEATTLVDYCYFLGFFELTRQNTYVVDPTRAIAPFLKDVFAAENTLPISDFLRRLSELLPMLDNGQFRRAVEDEMSEENWTKSEPLNISATLSHSLLRFRSALRIVMNAASDDPVSMRLKLPGDKFESISSIKFQGTLK